MSVSGAPYSLYLLVNNGAGGFVAPVEIVGPVGVDWAAAGDLNKDGNRDLVVLNREAETVLVLHGTGAGGFGPATTYIAAEVRDQFEIADLNSDGRLDIVGPSGEPSSIFVFLNTCASTDVADLSVGITGPTTGTAGDIVTVTMTVTNNGPATATDVVVELTGTSPAEFISTTCNATERLNCGTPSLASGDSVSFEITVRLYGGTGFLKASVTSRQADPDLANNLDTLNTVIAPGPLTFVVSNTLDDYAPGSLRYAIEQSNNNTGATNTISFAIGAPGSSHTIAPQSGLDGISNPVVIDGWTQGGAGYTGPPLIEINGASVPQFTSGLFISAGGSTVRGLAITGFVNGSVGINVQGNGGNVIQGNYIGTNLAGSAAKPNQNGIFVQAPNTIVGGATAAERNVISGNTGNAVFIGPAQSGGVVTSNGQGSTVLGNYIGLNAAGTAAIANNQGIIVQSPNVIIGGPTPAERNVISGNTGTGVSISASVFGGVVLSTGQGSTVLGNYIGVNAAGAAAIANGNGVSVQAANVTVGTPAAGNVISGNTNNGVTVTSVTLPGTVTVVSTPTNLLIQNNRVGTNAAGTAAIPNNNGLQLLASNPKVGGTAANTGNLISGNTTNGITSSFQTVNIGGVQTFVGRSDGVVVEGNTIGLNLAGTAAIGNQIGIRVGSPNAIIGGTATGAGNVIAGNTTSGGVSVQRNLLNGTPASDGNGAQLLGNLIGTDATGSATIGNGGNGVSITDVSNVIVGSVGAGRNVIARNTNGVSISGSNVAVTGIQVRGNYIGVAPDGTTARSNTSNGVNLSINTGSISGTVIDQNVISANNHGISSNRGGSITITGNRIGTNAAGDVAVGNGGYGVTLTGVSNSTIGGNTLAARNVISGNGLSGVTFFATAGSPTSNNTIAGNHIGTNAAGTAALANVLSGINIAGSTGAVMSGHVIGSVGSGANVISGNLNNGITIAGPADTMRIVGNLIGLNAAGTGALGNSNSGIDLVNGTITTTIGGTAAGEGNIISGNGTATVHGNGIFASGGGTHLIQGNRVGTNAAGNAAIPNAYGGIRFLNSNGNTVGGTTAAARNLVSGNGAFGYVGSGLILEGTSTNNLVQGNYIGTTAAGDVDLGNKGHGVEVSASNNTIGGTAAGAGNLIAFNDVDGVAVDSGTGNAIRGNSIHSNFSLAIDLAPDGPSANDTGDADAGGNNVQNFPMLTSASQGSTIVTGTLNSMANTTFALDFYANTGCNASTEAQRYLGSGTVATDGAGNGSFNITLTANSIVGESITATATDPNGNTSEVSACVLLTPSGAAVVTIAATDDASEAGADTGTFTFTRTGSTAASLTVDFTVGGSAVNAIDYVGFGASVIIPVGQASTTVTVTPLDDELPEVSETVTLTIVDGALYDPGSPSVATVNIADNDGAQVTIEAVDANASEIGPDPGTFRFTRTGSTTSGLTVTYAITGTAGNGSDYTGIGTAITFAAGQATVDRTITPINDALVDGSQTVILTVTDGAQYDLGAPATQTATVTITDNAIPIVTITAPDATASEVGPETGTFRFTRTGDLTFSWSVTYAITGTAANGSDYTGIGTAITFAAGQATVDRTITPINDAVVDGSETVILTVTDGAQYDLGAPATQTATVTITDNAIPIVTITAPDATASEVGPDPGDVPLYAHRRPDV